MIKQRIIANPVRLTGSIHPQQLSSLVAIDAMARHRTLKGDAAPSLELILMSGDVAVERAVQRAVARDGEDREDLGRDEFVAIAKRLEERADNELAVLFDRLGIQTGTERWRNSSDEVVRIARIAFVRLYEAGVLTRSDAVLESCPSCETVVDSADVDEVDMTVEQVRLGLPLADGVLEIDTFEPELLVGAVAIAVPAGTAPPEPMVYLPLLAEEVPIVEVVDLAAPVVVIPGHDPWSLEVARKLGYPVVQVLDADGVVRHPGPLAGLGRYAARAAATEQLAGEQFLIAQFEGQRTVPRCYRCGTVLVSLLGRHWILALDELVKPVMAALSDGEIAMAPGNALDDFMEAAERTGSWCVSQQLWSGQPIPVSTCLDCNQTTVSVEDDVTCGSCMGTLEPHTDVLDARFIAAVVPLALLGWPASVEDSGAVDTTLSVGRVGIESWALPMAALGLRLAGVIPFSSVIVNQMAVGAGEPGARPSSELLALVDQEGAAVVRAALLTGDFDIERARDSVVVLGDPPTGDADLAVWLEPYERAVSTLDAGGALGLVVQAAREGVADADRNHLRQLAVPLLAQ